MKRPTCILSVRPDLFASVCAYCPDKAEGDAWCEARGYQASHGICERCEAREFPFMAEARAAKREGREPDYLSAGVGAP